MCRRYKAERSISSRGDVELTNLAFALRRQLVVSILINSSKERKPCWFIKPNRNVVRRQLSDEISILITTLNQRFHTKIFSSKLDFKNRRLFLKYGSVKLTELKLAVQGHLAK